MNRICLILVGAVASLAVFCSASVAATKAVVKLADGRDAGVVTLRETTAGVLLTFNLKGLPPGMHGVHIHETGVCERDFSGAGQIYNPLGGKHGLLNEEGPMAGDLPNIAAAADGTVTAEILSPFLNLNATADETMFDADGASLVIFAAADDHETDPDGNAGFPIACGVIEKP